MQQGVSNDNSINPVPHRGRLLQKLARYRRNGLLLYWASFFILTMAEFLLGGQLSKILDGKNYAFYVSVLNSLPFYTVIMNLGLSYGIVYITSHNRELKYKIFGQALRLQTGWFLALVAAHIGLFYVVHTPFVLGLFVAIVVSYTYAYRLNINSLFLATAEYKKAAVANMLQKVALVVVFLVIFYSAHLRQFLNRHFIPVYPLIELGIVLLYVLVFSKANYRSLTAGNINYRNRLLRYGKYAMLNNGLSMAYYSIVAYMLSSSAIDLHSRIVIGLCFTFFRFTGVAVAPLVSVISPNLTKNKNNPIATGRLYKKYYLVVLAAGVAALVLCRYFFGYIIHAFYNHSYRDVPIYFNFFALLIPLSFLNSLNATVLAALGKIRDTFRTEVICTTVLAIFLAYNLAMPAIHYQFFYYVVTIHLTLKFLLQSYSAYSTVYKRVATEQ